MWIRLLALVGLLGVLGGMVNAERPSSQVMDGGSAQAEALEDPYPPPTPRP